MSHRLPLPACLGTTDLGPLPAMLLQGGRPQALLGSDHIPQRVESEIQRENRHVHLYSLTMKCRRRISLLLSWFIRPLEVSLSKYNLTCFWDCPPLKSMCRQQWMLSQKTLSSALIWVLLYKLSFLLSPCLLFTLFLFFFNKAICSLDITVPKIIQVILVQK